MSRILIACFIVVSASVVGLRHRARGRLGEAERARLRLEEQALRDSVVDIDARAASARRRHREQRAEFDRISVELRALRDAAFRSRPEPEPETEGPWPSGRPYFYLPKRLLDQVGYDALTPDGQLTAELVALLGLAPYERQEVRQAWADFRLDLQDLQARAAERLPEVPDAGNSGRRQVQLHLPALTDELTQLQSQLAVRMERSLGPTRAALIREALQDRIREHTAPISDRDIIITYEAVREPDGTVQHGLRFSDTANTVMYRLPIRFPLTADSPLWNYRHLFGDQPLLTPAEGQFPGKP